MKAKKIEKGTDVFINHQGSLQGSVVTENPFMHKNRLCVRLVGFGPMIVPVRRLGVM